MNKKILRKLIRAKKATIQLRQEFHSSFEGVYYTHDNTDILTYRFLTENPELGIFEVIKDIKSDMTSQYTKILPGMSVKYIPIFHSYIIKVQAGPIDPVISMEIE